VSKVWTKQEVKEIRKTGKALGMKYIDVLHDKPVSLMKTLKSKNEDLVITHGHLQEWVDWFIKETRTKITKQEIIKAIEDSKVVPMS